MVNKAAKGWRKEKKARDELTDDGWLICFKSIRWRFGCIDFATLFDIVAYKEKERKYISCKHFGNGNYYKQHQKEIIEFKDKEGLPNESYELWIWAESRWTGRGENKKWVKAHFIKIVL